MLRLRALILLLLLSACLLPAQEVAEPMPVDPGLITTAPYAYNGLIRAEQYRASGSLVGKGVVTTAAHVVYDDDNLTWHPTTQISYHPLYNKGGGSLPAFGYGAGVLYKWDSYSDRVQADRDNNVPDGSSSPNTFNMDFAVIYLPVDDPPDSLLNYPEVNVDQEEDIGILRDRRDKMLVGYPSGANIPLADNGLMHATEAADYFCWWSGLEDLNERDGDGLWIALYNFEDVTTYPGGSGGPMYVQDDLGDWILAGIAVGGGEGGMSVRAVDENAWSWIEQAVGVADGSALRRVEDLSIPTVTAERIWLEWTDRSSAEEGYRVLRHFNGTYEVIAELPPDAENFVDTEVDPGHVYHYRVQPFGNGDKRPPKSNEAVVTTPNSNLVFREAFNLPYLQLTSTGDSTWFIDGNSRLRAGRVGAYESSSIVFEIIGPGTLDFEWSAACEENVDYAVPSSEYFGLIYDALYLYVNGEPYEVGDEPLFLSGLKEPEAHQIPLPAGPHTIEWRYEKDPYTDEFEDTGYLHFVGWTPDPESPYSVYGGYSIGGSTYHASEWFGYYEAAVAPWIHHTELGWIYSLGNNGTGFWGYSEFEEIGYFYTSPEYYPFIYLPETDKWLFYFISTGFYGDGAWFLDFSSNKLLITYR